MLEWLDSVSPWWYAAGAAVFLLSSGAWLIYKIHRASSLKEFKQEHAPMNASISNEKSHKSSCDCDPDAEQLTIEIYQLSHKLDELLAHRQYKEASLVSDQLDAALNRFIAVKKTESVNKP
jgi:ABC-type nickel/cobalt efflux system permease component RcnA